MRRDPAASILFSFVSFRSEQSPTHFFSLHRSAPSWRKASRTEPLDGTTIFSFYLYRLMDFSRFELNYLDRESSLIALERTSMTEHGDERTHGNGSTRSHPSRPAISCSPIPSFPPRATRFLSPPTHLFPPQHRKNTLAPAGTKGGRKAGSRPINARYVLRFRLSSCASQRGKHLYSSLDITEGLNR